MHNQAHIFNGYDLYLNLWRFRALYYTTLDKAAACSFFPIISAVFLKFRNNSIIENLITLYKFL